MLRSIVLIAGGLVSASAFAGGYLDPAALLRLGPESFDARWAAVGDFSARKSDRIAATRVAEPKPVASIELTGLTTAAILYRDAKGRVLFWNDPATRTTTVVKGVIVPDVTFRRTVPDFAPRPAPARDVVRDKPQKLPIACEPAFSPVAAPSMADVAGRCFA